MRYLPALITALAFCSSVHGQGAYPYIVKDLAGAWPLGDGGPATSALLYYPSAVVPDRAGNLYILDSNNSRIRKLTSDGKISTFANVSGTDMKLGPDGNIYVGSFARIYKVSPGGDVTNFAGTGNYGYTGDGSAASSAQIGSTMGLAFDATGNLYFTQGSGSGYHVRQVAKDGTIRTIAGIAGSMSVGFNGDNQPATSAALYSPGGVAVDSSGNVYIADSSNRRVRKLSGGTITTVVGNGSFGQPVDGPAKSSPLGSPWALAVDASDNLYITDDTYDVVLMMTPGGNLSRIAGNFDGYRSPGDGPALNVSFLSPSSVSLDASGNIYVCDSAHLVRKIAPGGNTVTIAGRIHYDGDNGPALNAIFNQPGSVALDPDGSVYVADTNNYLIRKISSDGKITSYAGKLSPGVPTAGQAIGNAKLPYITALTSDSKGALYFTTFGQAFKIGTDGIVSIIAGNGFFGDSGDGGGAPNAAFRQLSGIAVDAAGNVYLADAGSNRIRKVDPNRIITAYGGNGTRGRPAGIGGLATSAQFSLSFRNSLAIDSKGNLYLADSTDYVCMIDSAGIFTTVVGNGNFGRPDGVQAATAAFSQPSSMVAAPNGDLLVSSANYGDIYRISGGVIRRISGNGNGVSDGAPALQTYFFTTALAVDANGDLYAVDSGGNTVRKLVVNSPVSFTATDGDRQSGNTGDTLPKALRVQLRGRAGGGVQGVTINFAVASGSAKLSTASTTTDASGAAGVSVTLGATAGAVTITATAVGVSLPPIQFTANATAPAASCTVAQPTVGSIASAGDFGGSASIASGSWIEIKGTNLAPGSRSWRGDDFNGSSAPTTLDGVSVTINGKRAFIGYISPTQINAQAPADSATGPVDVTVSTSSCSSVTAKTSRAAVAGGLLAPAAFRVGGTQYAAALFQDGVTFVGRSGLISGVPFRPAAPGETITLYGIGFGDVSPNIAPGTIVSAANNLTGFSVAFGSTPATVGYAGLAPNAVGLYQFNVVVPNVADGDYPLVVKVGQTAIEQTVSLTVKK